VYLILSYEFDKEGAMVKKGLCGFMAVWVALVLILILGACRTSSDSTVITSPPVITMGPNPSVPLAGILEVSTDEPTRVTLEVSDGTSSWSIAYDEFNTDHSLMVLGFHPGKTHTIQVNVIDKAGNETTAQSPLQIAIDPLPADFPPIEVPVSQPEKMEPGVTLFRVNRLEVRLFVAVDETGEVVWYYRPDGVLEFGRHPRRISNGNLMITGSAFKIVEMDMLGNVVQMWQPFSTPESEKVEGSTLIGTAMGGDPQLVHHDVFEMPSGNFLVLGTELRSLDNYPTSETDPGAPTETANVVGDVIVEFSRDGTVVNEWKLLDILDPYRIGYDSLFGSWDFFYMDVVGGTRDWARANAVIYDPSDDSIIVSARHQDAVVKFLRETGDLVWILGPHENWNVPFDQYLLTPVGTDFEWPYHQHAPKITANGDILLFDNGTYRASPFDVKTDAEDNYSRAVEYSINEKAMEITQVWEFIDPDLFSPVLGDADYLPNTGNVLITYARIETDPSIGNPPTFVIGNEPSARIIEVTHTTPSEKVFELTITDDDFTVPVGWTVDESERLPSLYP
jgi:arylsulfate sulfotransferase